MNEKLSLFEGGRDTNYLNNWNEKKQCCNKNLHNGFI